MPFERTRSTVAAMNERTKDAAQQNIDATKVRNQLPGKVLPPGGPGGIGYPAAAHAASHEDGGDDEVLLGNLAGELTDTQHGVRAGGDLHATVVAAGDAGFMNGADKSKLDGIAIGATANLSDATLLARANHTGTQSADTLVDGITNKAFLATERTKLAGIATGATANVGTVTSVDITAPAAGITKGGGPITSAGAITLALANDLAAVEGLSSTGLAVRSAADTWLTRTLAGVANRITVTNGDGVAGAPTFDIASTYVGQASITTLGTIGAGVWQGTKIGLAFGGTNADLSAAGGTGFVLKQTSVGAAITSAALAAADIPALDSAKITTGEIPRSPLTTRGDLLTRDATTHARVAIGAAGRYVRSNGTDPSWGQLDMGDAALGVLPIARGGTGVAATPSFSVHKNGTNQVITPTTYTKLTWSTEAYDTNNNFASDKFTPTVAGRYMLFAIAYWLSGQASQQYYTTIYKNGALHRSAFITQPTAFNLSVPLTTLVEANGSTDNFEVYVYTTNTVNIAIYGAADASSFVGIWVGP